MQRIAADRHASPTRRQHVTANIIRQHCATLQSIFNTHTHTHTHRHIHINMYVRICCTALSPKLIRPSCHVMRKRTARCGFRVPRRNQRRRRGWKARARGNQSRRNTVPIITSRKQHNVMMTDESSRRASSKLNYYLVNFRRKCLAHAPLSTTSR
jgi:hypothetical protein